jgi:hypothetical protein
MMDPQPDDPGPARRRRLSLGWPALLLAGWLLYELTADPGLASAVACAKFGWADLRAACWLRRIDPDRRRGLTCFWCYLAFGLWKVAVMATLTMILLGFLEALLGGGRRAGANNPSLVVGTLAAAGVGFVLSFLTTYVALWSALRSGVRIWLGVAPHRARTGRFWPPQHGKVNFAPYVAFTTLVFTVWLLVGLIIGLVLAWQPRGAVGIGCLVLVMLTLIGSVISAFPFLAGRLFARSPLECWQVEPGEAAYQAADGHGPDRSG